MRTIVERAKILELPRKTDSRGSLCYCEEGNHIPFEVKRTFWVFDTPSGAVRGHHAHRNSRQAHVCLKGSAKIWLDDGTTKQEVTLDTPNKVLILEPLIWHSFSLEEGSLLFVFTSDLYNESDYVREYNEFLNLVNGGS